MLTKEISNDVHIKSSPKKCVNKTCTAASREWLQFYRQLACTIAGQAFSLNETILATHTILLRLATDILSVLSL